MKASIRNEVIIPIRKHEAKFVSFYDLVDNKEHIALDFRKSKDSEPLVRIHSECLTGDVFGSGRCDCGEQLGEAVDLLAQEEGILLYLRQEGRGIGLYNKLDAYELQLKGFDTYEANRHLGLEDDLRDYYVAAQMLQALGVKKIGLLSNNPEKEKQLKEHGIEVVSRQPTGVFLKKTNVHYLKAKVECTNHSINLKDAK